MTTTLNDREADRLRAALAHGGELDRLDEEPATLFRSVDSVPEEFAVPRSAWLTPLFLLTTAALSGLAIGSMEAISAYYKDLLASVNSLPSADSLGLGSLGFRPFFAILITMLGLFSGGPVLGRLRFTLAVLSVYLFGVLVSDSAYLQLRGYGAPPPFSAAGNVTAGFIGVLALAAGVFALFHLPEGTVVRKELPHRRYRYVLVLLAGIMAGIGGVFLAFNFAAGTVEEFRRVSLLGGLGPGITLFLPALFLTLFFIGLTGMTLGRTWRWMRRKSRSRLPKPGVAFLVAAYNEAEQIDACIRTLDRAASQYEGRVSLWIVDNGSTDDTAGIADRAITNCETLNHGAAHVLSCETKGKSHALNYGLRHINDEIVVRVDADTIVEPSLLQRLAPYFEDPTVGGVSGIPLPKRRFSIMGLLRTIEVFYNIGFNRVAQSSLDAVMVLPGIMSAYRREALTRLGGFATGINGEDTDMSVRIGRLGYRLLVDMRIRVYTEVPGSFAHLREQRLRWSRSLYHVISRNMSAIRMLQGPRGIWVLTSAVYFSTRRLVTIPLIIYALILLAINPADPALRQGAAIGAMVIGPQIFILAVTLLVYRRFLYIPFIPAFLLFRMLRGYFALESFFTLRSMAPATAPAVAPTLAPQVAVADLRTARLVPSGAANGVSSPGPWKANGSVHANDSPFHPDNARGAARRSHGATNGKRGPEAPGWTAADRAGWPTPGTARSRSRKIFE